MTTNAKLVSFARAYFSANRLDITNHATHDDAAEFLAADWLERGRDWDGPVDYLVEAFNEVIEALAEAEMAEMGIMDELDPAGYSSIESYRRAVRRAKRTIRTHR